MPVLPCSTDSPPCPSSVCWPENAVSSWSGWWIHLQAWCLSEHQAGRKAERSLEQQLNPLHTPPLYSRTGLLLSGHVATNLRVTGFVFLLWSFSPALLHRCLHTTMETRATVGLKEFEALIWTRTLMIASLIAFVAAVAKWFNGITGRVKLKVDSLGQFLAGW